MTSAPPSSGPAAFVREATWADRQKITACLCRAFEDDPVSRFIFPDDRTRVARLRGFYREVIRTMLDQGAVFTDSAWRGAALWRRPLPPRPRGLRAFRDGLGMLLALRGATSRALRLEHTISAARPHEPHWYLAIVGTDPAHQGSGVGSALLQPVLRRCDEDHLPSYLESSKESNLAFYERHGFRVQQEFRVPDGPRLWGMLRPSLNGDSGPADPS